MGWLRRIGGVGVGSLLDGRFTIEVWSSIRAVKVSNDVFI